MIGPGKYDDLTTDVREKAQAAGVLLIVIGGNRGHGFSAQISASVARAVPAILRNLADQIEGDHEVHRP